MLSLVTIISIYREGGILKRLRATPLRPHTILTAHVLVKTPAHRLTMILMSCWRETLLPGGNPCPARVGDARAADQHRGDPLHGIRDRQRGADRAIRAADRHGDSVSDDRAVRPVRADRSLPPVSRVVARALPLTYAVSLLRGIWRGEGWSGHLGDVLVLTLMFLVCTAASAKVFRWE